MNGLGGLNKSDQGVVIGMVQLQLPTVATKAELTAQTARVVDLVGKARRNMATMDLVVFPEYMLHGLSMNTDPEIMCTMDGPEVAALKQACVENDIWGCFSIMELNPGGYPYNTGLIIDPQGEVQLYYRKMHPWVPVEPWEPGNGGIPVCTGPKGAKIGLIICHDGMFPEMSREAAYKGAEIMIRTAGYTAPMREAWRFTNQSNSFCNLMITANVCMCGSDGTFDSMGEAMIIDHEGTVIAHGKTGRVDEIITAEVRPDIVQSRDPATRITEEDPARLTISRNIMSRGQQAREPRNMRIGWVAILEGLPAHVRVTSDDIADSLARRRLGYGRGARMKFEQDQVTMLAGVRHGVTLGGPIAIEIGNTEWPKWESVMAPDTVDPTVLADSAARNAPLTRPRPGHADYAGMLKYGFDDARPVLERASARETAARVAAGTVARAFLREALGVEVVSHVISIGASDPYDGPPPQAATTPTLTTTSLRAVQEFWGA